MTSARLLSLRLQGFKSFAGRTVVEFGPGISAVVGPNGVGKSNLVDALRWTLGEQGRALRSRRAEDVIFAGSEARPALGMADVTVTLDNADAMLPLDYSVIELGRRLFRSGENEYLLNGTRVRLRDLEELLDGAHLADNAFLFIGQGMVDQALALRPEERRPLFDEVAGVRRHERRKRAAQERLVESEANVARVRDVIAELRPQARRLASQAQQQAARAEAAGALADGVAAAGRVAWYGASGRLADARDHRSAAQAEVDAAMAELRAADESALQLRETIDGRLIRGRDARGQLDEARTELQSARLEEARLHAELGAIVRDRDRAAVEAAGLTERIAGARRRLALPEPVPPGDPGGDIAALLGEAAGKTGDEAARDRAAMARDSLDARRRSLAQEEDSHRGAVLAEEDARAALASASERRDEAQRQAAGARSEAEERRRTASAARGRLSAAEDRLRSAERDLQGLLDRRAAIDERLRPPGQEPSVATEAFLERIVVETRLQDAVEAALGGAAAAAIASSDDVGPDRRPSSALVLRDIGGPPPQGEEGAAAREAARAEGGGLLVDALRADPEGLGRRLLDRAVWVPDLAAALRVASGLAPGWVVTTVAGDRIDSVGVFDVPGQARLALYAERAALARGVQPAEDARADAEAALSNARRTLEEAETAAHAADRAAGLAERAAHAATESEAAAGQRHELAAREAAWSRGQLERLQAEITRLEAIAATSEDERPDQADRLAAWSAYQEAVRERRRLEGRVAADEVRLEALAAERASAGISVAGLEAERERLGARLAELAARVDARSLVVSAAERDEIDSRRRLGDAEQARQRARERLRGAETGARSSEVDELEARMALDGVRERLLVELAGLGAAGMRALGSEAAAGRDTEEPAGDVLEAALDRVAQEWSAVAPAAEAPSGGRLAALRRRFHELGATNPYAAEEHAEVSARLEALEAQRDDLERAIVATRRLIGELEQLILAQFQATFRALEAAFERRFAQLFGGGVARLALTDPADPAASGVEIVARPPGKKTQPLGMLSGGERALTAVALLFAMLEIRPVPFCVLDEVDAALDEANIGRFAGALRELAATIQFIVITHNRGTIEEADALYGVTIGDDAVSRVISLRLEGPGPHLGSPLRAAVGVVASPTAR